MLLSPIISFIFYLSLFSVSNGNGVGMIKTPREDKPYSSIQSQHDKPNIIFIMADDLGWGNVGYHNKENAEVKTPNIDYLVRHGLQLNRHYVDAECSPTRTSFQSGRLPVHGNTNNNDGISDPSIGIHPDMTCIADKLKEAGYSTHMVGKWDCGFASKRQIPVNRGYDTSYGYLGKSTSYYTKMGDGVCSQSYMDIWENDAPAPDSVADIDLDQYSEYTFAERVLSKIDEMAELQEQSDDGKYPFFLFYASHLPHYPSQLPEDCVEKGYYKDFDDDESQCSNGNTQIFPGYYEDTSAWSCRAILQAQVAVLDAIVGDITASLKKNNLWERTLIIFTSDNGGSLELDETAGNNYPLRGGKASFLEGGIRATAFVSGGYLPEDRRDKIENGLMHISDWYVTFSEMLGVDPSDYSAVDKGIPDVDGYNMWPLIVGEETESPRTELIMNKNTIIHGKYKLIVGSSTKYAIWQSAIFPNASTPTQQELEETYLVCDTKKDWGCLFNVDEDPGEHNDIADDHPQIVETMRQRLKYAISEEFWESEFYGIDSCPESFELVKQTYIDSYYDLDEYTDIDACGCWMSLHNWNKFAGPYQDLVDDDIHFDIDEEEKLIIQGIIAKRNEIKKSNIVSMLDIGDLNGNYVIYLTLIITTVILLFVAVRNCQKTQIRADRKNKYQTNYGTTERV